MKQIRIPRLRAICPARRLAALLWHSTLTTLLVLCLAPLAALAQSDEEEEGPPDPEDITVVTDDNVVIKCTYYAGTEGESTVPVILVHGWEGRRQEFDGLAKKLQEEGHAVIVPDLRGHGESTTQRAPSGSERPNQEIDLDGSNPRNLVRAMVVQDMQAVKGYLMDRHNERELNIEMLTVVGSEEGAVVALNWCVLDWSWDQLPAIKQGRDVKAFVLISPPQAFGGLNMRQAMAHPVVGGAIGNGGLSAMIVVGKQDARASGSAGRIHNSLLRHHDPPPETQAEQIEKQDLFFVEEDTSLQGTELLSARALDLPRKIAGFIDLRMVRHADEYPWESRRNPLD